MIPPDEAIGRILDVLNPLPPEAVRIESLMGRVVAREIRAQVGGRDARPGDRAGRSGGAEVAFKEMLTDADLLLISGGVSVGDFDFTRWSSTSSACARSSGRSRSNRASRSSSASCPPEAGNGGREIPVFGLPGNPISAPVCLEEFVRPAVETLQGLMARQSGYHMAGTVENQYVTPEDRQQYLFSRVTRREESFRIHVIRPQGYAMVGMACGANALAVAPIGQRRVKPGDPLSFRWLK